MSYRIIISILILIFQFESSYCQIVEPIESSTNKSSKQLKEKLYYGGNLSFNIYNGWILFEGSPFVGYKLKPKILAASI